MRTCNTNFCLLSDENYETVGSFEDDPHSAGHHAATILWRNVEAYFGEITSEDLSYLDACSDKPRDDDKAFIIPKLGSHFPWPSVEYLSCGYISFYLYRYTLFCGSTT